MWQCWPASGLWSWLKCLALEKEFMSVGSRHLDKSLQQISRVWQMCSSKNRPRQPVFLAFLCFYCNMQNIIERKVMSWGRNVWKKMHDFIPKCNNPNNLSEMLPNELWKKNIYALEHGIRLQHSNLLRVFVVFFFKKNKSEISNNESALRKEFFIHY